MAGHSVWNLILRGSSQDHRYYIVLSKIYQCTFWTKFVKIVSIKLYQFNKSNKKPAEAGLLQEKKYMRKCKTITPAYCVINLWVYYNLINLKNLSKNRVKFMKFVKITCFTQSKLSFMHNVKLLWKSIENFYANCYNDSKIIK